MQTTTNSKKYVKMDPIEHVLLRSDMYVGSNKAQKTIEFVCVKDEDSYKILRKEISVSPAILRIFIEILSNATDNVERSRAAGIPCSYIKISINKETGETTVINDGDIIPIEINSEENMYNHSLIFGNLLTGSNYDDEEERLISGRNGIGSKASNIFSSKFTVKGVDPNNKLTFEQTWTNNMKDTTKPIIGKTKLSRGYTSVSYFPDFKQFGLSAYTDDIISIYLKYVIDVAMLSKVKVYFNEELIPVNNLQSYAKLYDCATDENLFLKHGNSEVLVTPSKEFQIVSFVNGIYTKLGGQHVDSWSEAIFRPLVDKFNKKGQPTLNIKDIKQFFRIFVVSYVVNPEFDSQSKHKLENPKVPAVVKTSEIAKILKWSVIEEIEDIIKSKEILTLKKSEKKKKGYVKVEGLDPANKAGTKESHLCSLILCEGLSAKTYAVAGIDKGIDGVCGRDYYGVLSLKGKCLNVRNSSMESIAKNKVITDLVQALNLQHGVDYTDDNNFKNLSYGKVVLLTDADCFADDTALLIRKQNKVSVIQIDSLFNKDNNINTQIIDDIDVWSDTKWVPIKAIRKKNTNKKIITINTYSGLVRCTEDHTFLLENGDEVKAKNIKVGDKLFRNRRLNKIPDVNLNMSHVNIKNIMKEIQCYGTSYFTNKKSMLEQISNELSYCSQFTYSEKEYFEISKEEAWVWGFFFADGSCGIYTFSKDREKQTKLNTENSRKRWTKWVVIHTHNVNNHKLRLEKLKNNNEKYGDVSKKLKDSQKRLNKAIENCNRTSKESKPEIKRTGYSFYISNCDYEKLTKSLVIMKRIYNYDWKIIEVTVKENNQRAFKLIVNGGKNVEHFISLMRSRFYTSDKLKKVPDEILNNNSEIQESFLNGYYDGDGFRWLRENKNSEGFDILGQVGAQGLCFIAERLGYSYNIKEKNGKSNVFTINISKRYRRFYPGEVKNIYETDYKDRYVYDIETETGKINAGIGNMVQRQCDGLHISGLIMNFFHSLFPSILKRNSPFLISMQTPIVRVFRKEGDLLFYDENKFKEFSKNQTSKIKCKYYKGLGTTKSEDVKDTFGEKMIDYINDDNCHTSFNKVFHVKFADQRKEWLEKYDPKTSFSLDDSGKFSSMNLTDFLNNEMIKFSHDDCKRSIPHLFDGLKESQRKVLYSLKKRNLTYNKTSLKVAQLAGYVAEVSNYHHGEQNLFQTITKMANEFPGSNNIPLLYRDGQFGSRLALGADAANARYIFTKMEPLTPLIFREEDDILLERVYDDGDEVEPKFYIPIIPMVLVNGAHGIGSGWSSSIPCYNPLDIIECIEIWLKKDGKVIIEEEDSIISYLPDLVPWYRGFTGPIEKKKDSDSTFTTYGIIDKDKNKSIVSELPIGMSTDKFKEMTEDWLVDKKVKSVQNYSTPNHVYFVITESDDGFSCNLKNMKLHSYLYTSNMVLFNEKDQLKKYTTEEIINDFCIMRYEFYKKRKAHMISLLDKELRHLFNKARFVEDVISKKLLIMNVEEAIIVENLEKMGFDKENVKEDEENSGGYNYLLKMQVRTFTSNKVKQLRSEIEEKNNKLNHMKSTSEKQLWLNDLEEFKNEYKKWLKIMEVPPLKLKQKPARKKKET